MSDVEEEDLGSEMDSEEEEGASDDDEEEDADYIPEPKSKSAIGKKKKKKKKKKRRAKSPDMTELSLPKPAVRLSTDLDLSATAVVGAFQQPFRLSRFGPVRLSKGAPAEAYAESIQGFRVTRGTPDDPRVGQYRVFYARQLPGMPFYDDETHMTLSLDEDRDIVSAAATFSFVDLTSHRGERLLILDVLALAVNPGSTERRGVGSLLVSCLKSLVKSEASLLNARPLLLTQADLACVGFWAKNSFNRAIDANALVRSLRRDSGATIFTGAVPMGCLLERHTTPGPKLHRVVDRLYSSSTASAVTKRTAEDAARAFRIANR